MALKQNSPAYPVEPMPDQFFRIDIDDFSGVNSRNRSLSSLPTEFVSFQNYVMVGQEIEKRAGSATYGTAQTGTKVSGLGSLIQDTGLTPLMMVNQTLYKYVSGAWAASDKTDYTANLPTSLVTFTSKSNASSVDTGTSDANTTTYLITDGSKSWTPGAYKDKCVLIKGEVKYIQDNSATVLFLSDKLNSDTDSNYQSQTYTIYNVVPFAFIANGTDPVCKYDLTTTTKIDGTQVSGGMALPKYKYMAVHQGRLWGALGTGNNADRVFASDVALGENVTTDTNLNINLTLQSDGDAVTGIASLPVDDGSVLLVSKNYSLHTVEGDNILNYRVHIRSYAAGCIAPKTLAVQGQTAFMLSHLGVVSVSSVTQGAGVLTDPIPLSRPIQDQIDAMTASQQAAACGALFQNKYILCMGSKAWYYDIEASIRQEKHVWYNLQYPYALNVLARIGTSLYAGDAGIGQAYQFFTGTQDNGNNVVGFFESGRLFAPGRPQIWVERVEFMADQNSSAILRGQISTDGAGYGTYYPIILNSATGRYVLPVQKRCYDVQFKITDATNTITRLIPPITVVYSVSEFGDSGTKG